MPYITNSVELNIPQGFQEITDHAAEITILNCCKEIMQKILHVPHA